MYKWTKVWAIQTDHDVLHVGDVITTESSRGIKQVKVTDVVHRTAPSGKVYDIVHTEDVEGEDVAK